MLLTTAIGFIQICLVMAQNDEANGGGGQNDNSNNEQEAQDVLKTLAPTTSPPAAASTPTMSPTGQRSFSPNLTFPPTLAPTVPADVVESTT